MKLSTNCDYKSVSANVFIKQMNLLLLYDDEIMVPIPEKKKKKKEIKKMLKSNQIIFLFV